MPEKVSAAMALIVLLVSKNIPISRPADKPQSSHAQGMSCDLSQLLERTRPPDPELVDLIEQAFLEGQISGWEADLAYLWLRAKKGHFRSKCYPSCYPKR